MISNVAFRCTGLRHHHWFKCSWRLYRHLDHVGKYLELPHVIRTDEPASAPTLILAAGLVDAVFLISVGVAVMFASVQPFNNTGRTAQ